MAAPWQEILNKIGDYRWEITVNIISINNSLTPLPYQFIIPQLTE